MQDLQERWRRIVELFGVIRNLTPQERDSYWQSAAEADVPLRNEVEELIAQDDQMENFLEPVWRLDSNAGRSDFSRESGREESGEIDAMIGATVSHYLILERLGAGANGVVYKAGDARLGRLVALKFLRRQPSSDPNALTRFQREARALSALNHPNICTIYDVDEFDGRPFIVMEYLKGGTLRERLRNGPLRSDELIELAIQITEGLDAAHSAGILHRDVKAANIFIAERLHGHQLRYQAKILDFGLTKAVRRTDGGSHLSPVSSDADQQTSNGIVLGTIGYMSPEQARGEELDARSDLFSLGIVLYEMATGHLPFGGATSAVTIDGILNRRPIAPAQLNSGVPPKLEEIILRLLEKDRALRYQTAAHLEVDLRQLNRNTVAAPSVREDGEPEFRDWPNSRPGVVTRPRKGRRAWVSVGIVLAIAAVMTFALVSYPRAPALAERESILLADFENTTGDPIFDETLRQVLAVKLEESPYLNVVPDDRIRQTLRLMGRSDDERITEAIGRDACQRQSVKAMITGSIASLGNRYVITIGAVNCLTGESIARAAEEAAGKEAVLGALGEAITTMRARLGESLASVQRFNVPVEEATTSSLDALKLASRSVALRRAGKSREAVPLLKRAVELDPNFAGAYVTLGLIYGDLGEPALRREAMTRAYERRHRVTELERLDITARYHFDVSGDMTQLFDALTLLRETYPAFGPAYNMLGAYYSQHGQYERSADLFLEGAKLRPYGNVYVGNAADAYIRLNRLDHAKMLLQQKMPNPNIPQVHAMLFLIAHLQQDETAKNAAMKWLSEHDPDRAFELQAAEASLAGKLRKAGSLLLKSADLSLRSGLEEDAALTVLSLAETEALFGLKDSVQKRVAIALKMNSGRDVTCSAARVLARAGFGSRARTLLAACSQEYPATHKIANAVVLPAIRASLDLLSGNATSALNELRLAEPHVGQNDHAIYAKALAYLSAGQPANARTEFQDLLDRPRNGLSFYVPVLRLGLGRALNQMGDVPGSRGAYESFLDAWKDADPDLPILAAARREYSLLK